MTDHDDAPYGFIDVSGCKGVDCPGCAFLDDGGCTAPEDPTCICVFRRDSKNVIFAEAPTTFEEF